MRVGTDGIMLGAWAKGGNSILDIGTGTGLIALMMAQRFTSADVTAIDIDAEACSQAKENAQSSPFNERIRVINTALQLFNTGRYDAIVCNPPYYDCTLVNSDERTTAARHTSSLTFNELFTHSHRLLTDDGTLSVIIPSDIRAAVEKAASATGLYVRCLCNVFTTANKKPPRRCLLAFTKERKACPETTEMVIGSDEHRRLTADFYISSHL